MTKAAEPKTKKKPEPKEHTSVIERRQKEQRIEAWLTGDKLKQIEEWLANGISETQLAKNMGISRQTLWKWKGDSEALTDTIQNGKASADAEVVNSLYRRTQGFHYTETKEKLNAAGVMEVVERNTKYLPPDMGAITFWLKNRMPEEWKDKVEELEDASKNNITIHFGSTPEEAEQIEAFGR